MVSESSRRIQSTDISMPLLSLMWNIPETKIWPSNISTKHERSTETEERQEKLQQREQHENRDGSAKMNKMKMKPKQIYIFRRLIL